MLHQMPIYVNAIYYIRCASAVILIVKKEIKGGNNAFTIAMQRLIHQHHNSKHTTLSPLVKGTKEIEYQTKEIEYQTLH